MVLLGKLMPELSDNPCLHLETGRGKTLSARLQHHGCVTQLGRVSSALSLRFPTEQLGKEGDPLSALLRPEPRAWHTAGNLLAQNGGLV